MRAIILAGGKGVRLAPLTKVIPKPLVPLHDKPILEIVLRQLRAQGFQHVTLAVGYLADLIRAYFGDGRKLDLYLDYVYEDQPLGTAGPLANIQGLTDTFLVMNADVLTDLDYQALVAFHRRQGGIATVGAYHRRVTIDLGVIIQDGNSRIQDYVEKPAYTYLVSMGIYVFEPAILDYIRGYHQTVQAPAAAVAAAPEAGLPPGPPSLTPDHRPLATDHRRPGYLDFPDLVKHLLAVGEPVHFYPFDGYWLDIGRPEDYARANEELERLNLPLDDSWLTSL